MTSSIHSIGTQPIFHSSIDHHRSSLLQHAAVVIGMTPIPHGYLSPGAMVAFFSGDNF